MLGGLKTENPEIRKFTRLLKLDEEDLSQGNLLNHQT